MHRTDCWGTAKGFYVTKCCITEDFYYNNMSAEENDFIHPFIFYTSLILFGSWGSWGLPQPPLLKRRGENDFIMVFKDILSNFIHQLNVPFP